MLTRADIEKMVNHLYRQTGAHRFIEAPDISIAAADAPFYLNSKRSSARSIGRPMKC